MTACNRNKKACMTCAAAVLPTVLSVTNQPIYLVAKHTSKGENGGGGSKTTNFPSGRAAVLQRDNLPFCGTKMQ